MSAVVYKFSIGCASEKAILEHLIYCNENFVPHLSEKVCLFEYSKKIFEKAVTFETWLQGRLVGLVAAYFNDQSKETGFITSVSTEFEHVGQGLACSMIKMCIDYARDHKFGCILLEVSKFNQKALKLYRKFDFREVEEKEEVVLMRLDTLYCERQRMERNYNKELNDTADHKYAYSFDFDVMHSYMLRSFIPFFINGKLLELGSFKGAFTKRFLPYFEDITCVEASDEAIACAKKELTKVNFVNSLFENAVLTDKYENIVMTHVLEHIDDPVLVLKRINDEWLSDSGRFFLVCPNANAPSRQIAVKMGLISHNAAVTEAESKHGHKITYSLDTLERDAKAAGLKIIHRSGIFFKALANFQWDQLLKTDIVSKEYMEGCYQLGQLYPDLCSSIFLMCEKGK